MRIGELEKRTGVSTRTIRFYDDCGLIPNTRGQEGYRDFDDACVERLIRIRQLREIGVAIADIRLWCDGVVDLPSLIRKRQKELDDENLRATTVRRLCDAMLDGEMTPPEALPEAFDETIDEKTVDAYARLALGVDIGTTTISAQLLDLDSGCLLHTYCLEHQAAIHVEGFPGAYAQDSERLCSLAERLVQSVTGAYPGIVSIGVTGQMHGIVCLDEVGRFVSPLYTWQNELGHIHIDRLGMSAVAYIHKLTGQTVPTGYGLVTYLFLRESGYLPPKTHMIASIQDAIEARLCGCRRAVTHPSNAAAFGLYDDGERRFSGRAVRQLRIPEGMLPQVVDDYTIVGTYQSIPVAVAIGDNQAGVFGTLQDGSCYCINVGTSGQVSLLSGKHAPTAGELRPFIGDSYLLTGAILCGGRAYEALATLFCTAMEGMGLRPNKAQVYKYLNEQALTQVEDPLQICTSFLGSREDPSRRGSMQGLSLTSFTPAHLAQGIVYGIADELYDLYVRMGGDMRGATNPVVLGNAMRKNPALRKAVADRFGKQPRMPAYGEEAAYGAALYGALSAGIIRPGDIGRYIVYRDPS